MLYTDTKNIHNYITF